jgi:enoyl-CoA hydratase/carnithine racemase
MTQTVLVSFEQGVQILTLNRPDKMNALTPEMYEALAVRLDEADRDPAIRVTLITGVGRAFTAGNDMADFAMTSAMPDESEPEEDMPVGHFIRSMREAQKPVMIAVNGLAVGIGVTMLLLCDIAYAAESATFQLPFVRLGLVPEAGSSLLLPRFLGRQKAGDLLLTGRKIGAAKAESLGLLAEVFPDDMLAEEALTRAKQVAALSPTAIRITKSLIRDIDNDVVGQRALEEHHHFSALLRSAEAKEALSAFFEKRPADFSKIA